MIMDIDDGDHYDDDDDDDDDDDNDDEYTYLRKILLLHFLEMWIINIILRKHINDNI